MSQRFSAWVGQFVFAVCFGYIFPIDAVAALTTIENSPDIYNEPNLIGINPFLGNANPSILETLYGEVNVVRIDDDVDTFMVHAGTSASVKTVAKFVGLTNPQFGYFPSGSTSFVSLFTLSGSGYSVTGSGQIDALASGGTFATGTRFAGSIYSSNTADNPIAPNISDHLVTFKIVGNAGHPTNVIGAYVLGWESSTSNTDNDYQDVVFEISGVSPIPEPTSGVMFLLYGLAMVVGRRSRR